jgi:rhodanese-related sulfurtransferase
MKNDMLSVVKLPLNSSFVALLALILGFSIANVVFAADPASVPKKKVTTLGLYYTPLEANNRMLTHGSKTIFIDVRDPVEVNFTGMPSVADANIPFKFTDMSKWHMKKRQFGMKKNKNFISDVAKIIKAKGLTKSDTVILMCRSGVRSAKATNLLATAGYTNVYNIMEGFEGDSIKKGTRKGQRTINGWKNSGVPWDTPRMLDIKKMYGTPLMVDAK